MKRRKHPQSILHEKNGTCYLCVKLYGNHALYPTIHEHHAFPGNPGRRLSEEHGFKVYLCIEHHVLGNEAVHNNKENLRMIQMDCQEEYEKEHTREEFMAIMGKNYLTEKRQQEKEYHEKAAGLSMEGFFLLEDINE